MSGLPGKTLDDGLALIDGELEKYREALELILSAPPEVLRLLRDETQMQLLTARLRLGKLAVIQDALDGKLAAPEKHPPKPPSP